MKRDAPSLFPLRAKSKRHHRQTSPPKNVTTEKSSGDLWTLRFLVLLLLALGDVDVVVDVVFDLASKSVDSPQLCVDHRVQGLPASSLALLEDSVRLDAAGLEHPVVPPLDVDPRRAAHEPGFFGSRLVEQC